MDIMLEEIPTKLTKAQAVDLLVGIRRALAITTADMIDKIASDRETDIHQMVLLISKITHNVGKRIAKSRSHSRTYPKR